jgi:serine protease Do
MNTKKLSTIMVILPLLILTACSGSLTSLAPASNSIALAAPNPTATAVAVSPALGQASVNQAPVSQATGDLSTLESVFEQIYSKVNPSVVNIQVTEAAVSTGFNGRQYPFGFGNSTPQTALGSGIIWDTQGDILTNNHVVSGASQISVTFSDGTTVPAKVVGTDPYSDLAVVKVSAPASLLVPIEVVDSTQVKVGQIVIAIGNPFGLQGTMTQGIISGLQRSLPVDSSNSNSQTSPTYSIPDIIQTDASINPGNSGGALVDEQGRLVGVTAAIRSNSGTNSGIGFVIPSAIVSKVIPALISSGSFKHSWLGVSGTNLTSDLAQAMNLSADQRGALIIDVTSGGPAAQAGLVASARQVTINGEQAAVGGDVITAINGQTMKSFDDVTAYLFENTQPGQTVTLTILRQGREQQVKLTLGNRPTQ